MPTNILSIPAELQCLIAEQIADTRDLLNLRLVCRELSAACLDAFVEQHIAERTHLHSKEGLQLLAEISTHPVFASELFEVNLVPLPNDIEKTMSASIKGREWLEQNRHFRGSEEDVMLLTHIMDNADTAGGGIVVMTTSWFNTQAGITSGRCAFEAAGGKFYLEEGIAATDGSTLRAIHLANALQAPRIETLDIRTIDLAKFDATCFPRLENTPSPWSELTDLCLTMGDTISDELSARLKCYLQSARSLNTLYIVLSGSEIKSFPRVNTNLVMLTDTITPSTLQDLTIGEYGHNVQPLLRLLLKHKSSLRHLALVSVCLTSLEDWRLLFNVLADGFELESVNFCFLSNVFLNHWNEMWLDVDGKRVEVVGKSGREDTTRFLHSLAAQGSFGKEGIEPDEPSATEAHTNNDV